jgi:hypothetical protein
MPWSCNAIIIVKLTRVGPSVARPMLTRVSLGLCWFSSCSGPHPSSRASHHGVARIIELESFGFRVPGSRLMVLRVIPTQGCLLLHSSSPSLSQPPVLPARHPLSHLRSLPHVAVLLDPLGNHRIAAALERHRLLICHGQSGANLELELLEDLELHVLCNHCVCPLTLHLGAGSSRARTRRGSNGQREPRCGDGVAAAESNDVSFDSCASFWHLISLRISTSGPIPMLSRSLYRYQTDTYTLTQPIPISDRYLYSHAACTDINV